MRHKALSVVFLAWLVLLLGFHAAETSAFPYGRTSAVTELTPATLPAFINTHKPVVVLFYAPWCGHCKQFHPEYERFAQAVKGAIRVGALNADAHHEVGGQFGIRGFPTIKYWRMGSKSIPSPEEYQGQRTASALQQFMMAGVSADRVRTGVATVDALEQVVFAAPKRKVAVLFSAKTKVPPIFSVLAYSPKLKELPFVFVEEKNGAGTGVGASLGVSSHPTIAVVEAKEGASADQPQQRQRLTLAKYTGKDVAYEPLAKFFLASLEGTMTGTAEGAAAAPPDEAEQRTEAGNTPGVKRPRKALPVAPVAFDPDETLLELCAQPNDLTRLNGGVAWCVISLSSKVDLSKVYAEYQNEPFLFFDASEVGAEAVDASFQKYLNGLTMATCAVDVGHNAQDGLVFLRKPKPGVLRAIGFTGVDSTEALRSAMEKVSNGASRPIQWKL